MSDASRTRPDHQLPQASLGKRREQPFSYTPALLEAIPVNSARPMAHQQSWVTLTALRFSSLCPITSQPDWAELTISFIPDAQLIESKSLKEYLTSFRQHGDFHEDVCRIIVDDLVACIRPRYLELCGRFDSRGSIAIWPFVQYARPEDAWAGELLRHRALNYIPGAWAGAPGSVR